MEKSDIQVGREIWVEEGKNAGPPGCPRWDHAVDLGGTGRWTKGVITHLQTDMYFLVVLSNGEEWAVDFPGSSKWLPQNPGWWRLTPPDQISPSPAVAPAVWTELLGKPTRADDGAPTALILAAIQRGNSFVRRTLREWPYGKILDSRVAKGQGGTRVLELFWKEDESKKGRFR